MPEPDFTLTEHAQRRLRERDIPLAAVEQVLNSYHTSRPAPRREGAVPTVIFVGDYEGRNLKVYVIRDPNPPQVSTVVGEGE